MAGMGDIGELLGGQGLVDETNLPDADGAPLEGDDLGEGGEEHQAPTGEQPADQDPYAGHKRVPLGALQEERRHRQEIQTQLQQQQELNQRMQERFNQIMERFQQPQQPQQPTPEQAAPPAFVDDPEGHIRAVSEHFQRQLDEVRQFFQGAQHQQHAAAQGHMLAQKTAADEAEFVKTAPDYHDAARFFAERRLAEYTAVGMDPVSANAMLQRDYQGLAIHAAQRGQNAASLLYNVAKTMGFAKAPAQRQPGATKPAPTTLASVGGAPRTPGESGSLTLEALADMTDAEFEKFFNQMERGSRQRPKI